MNITSGTTLPAQHAQFDAVAVIVRVIGIVSVCLVALMIGLGAGVQGDDVYLMLLALTAVVVGALPFAIDAGRPRQQRHVFLTMLAMAYTLQFVMPIFVLYIPAVGPVDPQALGQAQLWPRDIIRGQAVAIIGILGFYAGYGLPIRRVVQPILPQRLYEWRPRAALIATATIILTGWFFYLGRSFGLIPAALGSGVIGGLANATVFSSSLMLAIYLRYRSRVALLMLSTIVPATMLINFMTGSKRAVLIPAAMTALTWVVVERRIRLRWVAAGLLALILLYPVAQFWRQDILQENTLTIADVVSQPGAALSRTGDFLASGRVGDYFADGFEAASRRLDAVGVVSLIVRDTPSVSPFQNGRTLALIPVAYVPRILWPDKPVITIGQWVTEAYVPGGYLVESNVGTSWVGEFYLNYGVTAVILGMMVMGLMFRFAHEALMRPGSPIPIVVAATIVISELALAVQSSVVIAINGPIFTLIPLVLTHLAMRVLGGVQLMELEAPSEDSADTANSVA